MTLFDLAAKNIRRNLKSYALYFGSIIFSIVIYFTFVTLKYSEDMVGLADSSMKIEGIMNVASIILIIFVGIFIAYSNSFFMKKRKKEVGLYSLLGVRKKQIGFLLFFENIIMGLASLIVGILIGFLLSKVLLTILIRLMGFDLVAGFAFSGPAVVHTAIVFLIIFLFTSLQGYRVIYRFKLIELFQADKQGEALPKAKAIVAFLGVGFLVFGYWLASQDLFTSKIWAKIGFLTTPLLIVLCTVIGTYLLFHSVFVYIVSKLKAKQGWAWRGLNMMTTSQLLYRIRGNTKTLTLIAILSATTVTAGGAVFSLYYSNEKDTHSYLPQTFMWQGEAQEIKSTNILYEKALQTKTVKVQIDAMDYEYTAIAESQFQDVLKAMEHREIKTLKSNEAIILDPYYDARFSQLYNGEKVQLPQIDLTITKHLNETLFNVDMFAVSLVVPDDVFNNIENQPITYQIVKMKDEKQQLDISKSLQQALGDDVVLSSFPKSYKGSLESLGSLLFVGTFLGLVFLVATGSIIYFKMLTEAEEDRAKYEVLHKIGVNEKAIKKTIRAQVGVIFAVPLIVGLLHSAFALQAFANLFMFDILKPVVIWMLAYGAVYILYYFLTVSYFNKTIQQNIKNEG